MKYLVKLIVITLVFFTCTSVTAEQDIIYIDMEKVMNESKAGKSAQKYLANLHKSNIDEFKKIEKNLKEEELSIIGKKNILKKEDYKSKIDSLRKKVNEYQSDRREKMDKVAKLRSDARKQLLEKIRPILNNYAKENNISLILDKKLVVLGKQEKNITEIIVKKLNKELPSLNLK